MASHAASRNMSKSPPMSELTKTLTDTIVGRRDDNDASPRGQIPLAVDTGQPARQRERAGCAPTPSAVAARRCAGSGDDHRHRPAELSR